MIACLFAPTVPSEPSPQNLQRTVPSDAILSSSFTSRDVFVTSSLIPNVNWSLLFSATKLSNTALINVGVVSFEPSPNLPPIISG